MQYKKTTLKNGLRIITVPMTGTQTATVIVMTGVGSRYETESEAGLSHFIEHMMFKGTQKRPTTLVIAEELDAIGGEYNAFTSKDTTAYYAKVDAQHIETAMDVIADMYLHSKIEEEEIKKEKGAIIQELKMYQDMPARRIGDVFESLLYRNSHLGREIIGYKKTVEKFRRQDFVDYMEKFYVANNTVICVAGKFQEKTILKKLEGYFSQMKKGKKREMEKIVETQNTPAVKIEHKKTDQTHLALGNRAYKANHKNRFALSLLSIILGGNMSSRLFIEVRERRGLAYRIKSNTETYDDCGYFVTQAGVDHGKLEMAVGVILEEYRKIATQKIEERELQKAKDFLKGSAVMHLESSDEVAMFFIEQTLSKKKIMTLEELFAKIDRVTTNDILRVAQEVLREETLNLAVIGPHKNEAKLKVLLKY
jgi:predicted Zn-dependent peptidase